MEGMGSLPPGYGSMGMPRGNKSSQPRLPKWYTQKWKSLAQPQPHTPYGPTIPGRKLKVRGRAVLDANPYRTSLKALQRGTNLPVALIGGEVRGHGASRQSRQDKRKAQDDHEIAQARRANNIANAALARGEEVAVPGGIEGDGTEGVKGQAGPAGQEGQSGKTGSKKKKKPTFNEFFASGPERAKKNSWAKWLDYRTKRKEASSWGQLAKRRESSRK